MPAQIDAVARAAAAVLIYPTAEEDLGDGLRDLPSWTTAGVPIVVGSDSHAKRDALEELRWRITGSAWDCADAKSASIPAAASP